MHNRLAYFLNVSEKDEEKKLTLKIIADNSKQKIDVSCLNKKYFKKEDKDKIVGYIHLNNKRKYTGKEYATLLGIENYRFDIYSKKKIYEAVVGYIKTTDDEYLAVVKNYLLIIILGKICLLGLILGLCFGLNNNSSSINPDGSVIIDNPIEKEDKPDISAEVTLPDGQISFDGTLETLEDEKIKKNNKDYKGNPYIGQGYIEVTILINDKEITLIEKTKVNISNGEIPDVYIDFTKLNEELLPGIYEGYVYITYEDGTTICKEIEIIIVSSTSGSIGVNYSDKVNINLKENTISLKYVPYNSPTNSRIEILLNDEDKEYILGISSWIKNGQQLQSLKLKDDAKKLLSTGSYRGIMRVYVDQGTDDKTITDLHTDIEVTISVQ